MKLLTLCVICGVFVAQTTAAATKITTTTHEKDVDELSDYSDLFGDAFRGMAEYFGIAEDDSDGSDSDNASGSVNGNKALTENEAYSDDVIMDIDALFRESLEDIESVKQDAVYEFLKGLRDMLEGFLPPEEIKIEDNNPVEQSNSQLIGDSINGTQAIEGPTNDKNQSNEPKESSMEQRESSTTVGYSTTQTVTNNNNNTASEIDKKEDGE